MPDGKRTCAGVIWKDNYTTLIKLCIHVYVHTYALIYYFDACTCT